MRRAALLLIVSTLAARTAACSAENRPLKWTEDVKLPDGRVVTLTRHQEFKGPHMLGETPTESDYWFEFKHPDTGEVVRWESDRDLSTFALMISGTTPFLLVGPDFGGFDRRGCPNPPYLLYQWTSGEWIQMSLEQIPVRRFRVNMTFSPIDERQLIRSSGNHLTVAQTQDSQREFRPYIINFDLLAKQTFVPENCGRELNWLIEK